MATKAVKRGQSWWDVGIELSGAWEAGIDLALSLGVSMTQAPVEGVILRSSKSYNRPMELYCHAEGVSPATVGDGRGSYIQIFSSTFNTTFR